MSHKEIHDKANDKLTVGWDYDADHAAALQLAAIYQLLDERLPEKPMTTIVPAARPGVEDATPDFLNGKMVFNCKTYSSDTLSVTKITDMGYEFYAENETDEAETVIHLSETDAKRLARAILGAT